MIILIKDIQKPIKLVYLVVFSFAVLMSFNAIASDDKSINATIVYGLDTNPHRLNTALSPIEQQFASSELKFSTNYSRLFYFRGRAEKSVYFDDARADKFTGSTSVSAKSKFKIFNRKFKYKLGVSYRTQDRTYVSKRTGLVATFDGESIADRYDSSQINYNGRLSYKPYPYLEFEVTYQDREKTYQEFEIPGLSNFDYQHGKVILGMNYESSDQGKFFLSGEIKNRTYLDKRGKDLLGNDIANTDLEYDYLSVDIGYTYRPDKKVRWKYTYNYEERRDNVSGYYNATSGYISILASHQIGDYHFFKGRLKYSKFSLINQIDPGDGPLEDEGKEKQGASIMFGYELIVATLFDTNIALYLELEHGNFVNSDISYTYEQSKAYFGFRWSGF